MPLINEGHTTAAAAAFRRRNLFRKLDEANLQRHVKTAILDFSTTNTLTHYFY